MADLARRNVSSISFESVRIIRQLENQLEPLLRNAIIDSFERGSQVDQRAFVNAGVDIGPVVVPDGRLVQFRQNANRFTAAAIQDFQDRLDALSFELISGERNVSSFRVRVRNLAKRLATQQLNPIASTEIGGAFSEGHLLALGELDNRVPGLKKRWVATGSVQRRGHTQVMERTRRNPIGINERFRVADFSFTGTTDFITVGSQGDRRFVKVKPYTRRGVERQDLMLYPRDLTAGSSNRINCKCTTVTVVDSFEGISEL